MFSKSLITNITALTLIVVSYVTPKYSETIYLIGLFALSGGITNWLAIHMLFEKIPFFYGSGVIPSRFEEFKLGIKKLIMTEFFTSENINIFLEQQTEVFTADINNMINFDHVFDGLVEAIEGSSMGNLLAMLGGRKALVPLKEPVTLKLREIVNETKELNTSSKNLTSSLLSRVEQIIDQRLEELTPVQVKNIIQEMIQEHLGWLVVWGGAVGGIIGFAVATV